MTALLKPTSRGRGNSVYGSLEEVLLTLRRPTQTSVGRGNSTVALRGYTPWLTTLRRLGQISREETLGSLVLEKVYHS